MPPKGHPNSVSENIFYENLAGKPGFEGAALSRAWNKFFNKVDINLEKMD